MLHNNYDVFMNAKMTRRSIITSLASISGVLLVGCGTNTGSSKTTLEPTATSTTRTPTPIQQPGTTLLTYKEHTRSVSQIAWSPDSKFITSFAYGDSTHVWNASTGERVLAITHPQGATPMTAMEWSPDGKYIVTTDADYVNVNCSVYVWDAKTGQQITKYAMSSFLAAISPNGELCAGKQRVGNTIQIWKTLTGEKVFTFTGHHGEHFIESLSWSPDNKFIASTSTLAGMGGANPERDSIKIWDILTGEIKLSKGEPVGSFAAAWSPDSTTVASEAYNSSTKKEVVNIWNATSGEGFSQELQSLDESVFGTATSLSWSPNNSFLAVGLRGIQSPTTTPYVQVISSKTPGNILLNYKEHSSDITDVAWSPDGTRIASAASDKTVRVWQAPV